MKYFTPEWHAGDLSEEAFELAFSSYRKHIEMLASQVTGSIRTLATELNLHDALIEEALVNTDAQDLSLTLLVGDLQCGYRSVTLTYEGVEYSNRALSAIEAAASNGLELISDELDRGTSTYEHRLYFSPSVEAAIGFQSLRHTEVLRADRSISLPQSQRFKRSTGSTV